jgi:redox-sensitive bicupin YhaK (pirin superfamily)
LIQAGEVQRMFSGEFIQHQELNKSDDEARVIQIWFAVPPKYMGLEPQYEQIPLAAMPTHLNGDGLVSRIIGPGGATDAHVQARLTATVLPPNGQTTVELPEYGEDLFLYFVNGRGRIQAAQLNEAVDLYDVLIASDSAETATITTGSEALTFLSFYLPPFIQQ